MLKKRKEYIIYQMRAIGEGKQEGKRKMIGFNEKKYGKYILVIKESDEYKENSELFDNMHRLIENDYAFIGYY